MTMPTFDPMRFIRMTPEQRAEAIEKLRAEIKKANEGA